MMPTRTPTHQGITLIEIVIVFAIIGILVSMGIGVFSNFTKQTALDSAVQQTLSVFEDARSRTLASERKQQFGIHIGTTQVILFEGGIFSASAPTNKSVVFDWRVTVSSISLTGGASEIVFERLTGKADVTGSITFTLVADVSQTRTLTINKAGVIELQ